MKWSLYPSTGDHFVISDGSSRVHKVAESDDGKLTQQTDVVAYTDADWVTAFPDRAVCSESLSLPVSYPPCASVQEAIVQRFVVPASCPKGGVLYGHHQGEGVVYAQAWRESITSKRTVLSNEFVFAFNAVDPQPLSALVDDDEFDLLVDDDDFLPLLMED